MVIRRGFSLVEIIVALTLLSVAMLGVAGSGLMAAQLLAQAELHEAVTIRAQSILDSLVIHEVVGSGRVRLTPFDIDWTATQEDATVNVTHQTIPAFTLKASKWRR